MVIVMEAPPLMTYKDEKLYPACLQYSIYHIAEFTWLDSYRHVYY